MAPANPPLMKILAGIHADYEDQIEISGAPVNFAGVRDAERHGIAIIHQELNLVQASRSPRISISAASRCASV